METTLNPTWQEFADKAVQDVVTIDGLDQDLVRQALISIDPGMVKLKPWLVVLTLTLPNSIG